MTLYTRRKLTNWIGLGLSVMATAFGLFWLLWLLVTLLGNGLRHIHPRLFTESTPAQQDQRLRAWETSRIALRRTGFHALKRLVYASYYASPETWSAVGYPGPPVETGVAGRRAR